MLACTPLMWHQTPCGDVPLTALYRHLTLRLWARSQGHKLPPLGALIHMGVPPEPGHWHRSPYCTLSSLWPPTTVDLGWAGKVEQAITALVPNLRPLEPLNQQPVLNFGRLSLESHSPQPTVGSSLWSWNLGWPLVLHPVGHHLIRLAWCPNSLFG